MNPFVLVLLLVLELFFDYEKKHEEEEELKACYGFNGSMYTLRTSNSAPSH